jgi:hypothetical protein
MREQIKKRLMIHRAIKHLIDTNILNKFVESLLTDERMNC